MPLPDPPDEGSYMALVDARADREITARKAHDAHVHADPRVERMRCAVRFIEDAHAIADYLAHSPVPIDDCIATLALVAPDDAAPFGRVMVVHMIDANARFLPDIPAGSFTRTH